MASIRARFSKAGLGEARPRSGKSVQWTDLSAERRELGRAAGSTRFVDGLLRLTLPTPENPFVAVVQSGPNLLYNQAMNIMERDQGEAKLHYLDGEYEVVIPGSYVICAVTAAHIPLDALRYWSVDLQEAYASPAVATARAQEKGLVPR